MNTQKINAGIKDFQAKIKRVWDDNPVLTIALGIGAANAGAKLIKASSEHRNSKAWSREVKRREKNDKKNR